MISSLDGSCHPGKYSYEISYEYLSRWGREPFGGNNFN